MDGNEDTKNDVQPVLVLLGIDAEKKPHASRFAAADAAPAIQAAQLMGFHAVNVVDVK